MRSGHRSAAVVIASLAFTAVPGVPAFAQSNGARWRPVPASANTARAPGDMVRVYDAGHRANPAASVLPANLAFPESYRAVLETMLQRSPMFRRQCLRIAQAPFLRVFLRNFHRPWGSGPRARTSIVRTLGGHLVATVQIRALDDTPELIAHELEHIIEQLDGVDLSARSAIASSGVRICDDGSYETARAVHVGRVVARDSRRGS